jgi:hypothetical protein
MNESELRSAIREILLKHWDPIGFGEFLPRKEYDRYIPDITKLVISRARSEQLRETLKSFADYLSTTIPDQNTKNTVDALQRLYSKKPGLTHSHCLTSKSQEQFSPWPSCFFRSVFVSSLTPCFSAVFFPICNLI